MKRCIRLLLTAGILALGIFLVTLPAQIAHAHIPALSASAAQSVQMPSINRTPTVPPKPEPAIPDSVADDVAWLTGVVISLPVLAVLLAVLVSTTRQRRARRPVKRPGQSY
jgi:multisubunit Na+/H+ antiporter MnhC subunit